MTTDLPELRFDAGLPGFDDARRFVLVRLGGHDSPFSVLRSLEDPELEFVVVPPGVFFPGYEPEIDDDLAARLDLRSPEDALLLVIVTVAQRPTESTANLLGPLVINQRTRNAAQAVLDPARYATRELLLHTAGDGPGGPGEVPNPEP